MADLRKLKDKAAEAAAKGKLDKAAKLFREAVEADPKDVATLQKLADVLRRAGRTDEAIDTYREVADRFGRDGLLIKAIAISKTILELDPEHDETQTDLANLYARKAQAEKSRPPVRGTLMMMAAAAPPAAPVTSAKTGTIVPPPPPDDDGIVSIPLPKAPPPAAAPPPLPAQEFLDPFAARPDDPFAPEYPGGPLPPQAPPGDPFALQASPADAFAAPAAAPEGGEPPDAGDVSLDIEVEDAVSQPPPPPPQAAPPPLPGRAPRGVPATALEAIVEAAEAAIDVDPAEELFAFEPEPLDAPAAPQTPDPGDGRGPGAGFAADALDPYVPPPSPAEMAAAPAAHVEPARVVEPPPPPPPARASPPPSAARPAPPVPQPAPPRAPASPPVQASPPPHRAPAPPPAAPAAPEPAATGLPRVPIFSDLSPDAFVALARGMVLQRVAAGEAVIREGETGTSFYVVASGHLAVSRRDEHGNHLVLGKLGEGDFFGEMALLSGTPRTATVTAEDECEVLELRADVLASIAKRHPHMAGSLRRFYRQRLLANAMAVSPIFRPFARDDRKVIMARFRAREVAEGEVVVTEGKPSDGLYVVLEGAVDVVKRTASGDTAVARLREGDVFGEMSCLRKAPASASVVVARSGTLLRLPRADFDWLVVTYPQVLERVSELSEERSENLDAILSGRAQWTEEGLVLV